MAKREKSSKSVESSTRKRFAKDVREISYVDHRTIKITISNE